MNSFLFGVTLLCLALLHSCNDPSTTFLGEQCSPQMAEAVLDPGTQKLYIPVEGSTCRCRQYKINKDQVGPVRNENGTVTVTNHPLPYCNLIKGYHPKTDTRLVNTIDWWRVQINDWLETNSEEQSMDAKLRVEIPRNR